MTNRKLYVTCQMMPLSVTLSDLEGHFLYLIYKSRSSTVPQKTYTASISYNVFVLECNMGNKIFNQA